MAVNEELIQHEITQIGTVLREQTQDIKKILIVEERIKRHEDALSRIGKGLDRHDTRLDIHDKRIGGVELAVTHGRGTSVIVDKLVMLLVGGLVSGALGLVFWLVQKA